MDEFAGRPCYGGIDLALMWDMSAYALLFPWGREENQRRFMRYRLVLEYFIPEEGFLQLAEKVPSLLEWRDRGLIHVTEGNTFDEPTYLDCVVRSQQKYDLRGIAYDKRFAHSLAQTLQDVYGIEMLSFYQNGAAFGGPWAEFERAVEAGVMEHNGNPVLNWNVQNAVLVEKPGNLKILKKPIRGDHKKIDGLVAAVMALGMCLSRPEVASYYANSELEVF